MRVSVSGFPSVRRMIGNQRSLGGIPERGHAQPANVRRIDVPCFPARQKAFQRLPPVVRILLER